MRLVGGMLMGLMLVTASHLLAQTVWNGNTTVWNTGTNWSGGTPTNALAASFGNPTGGNYNLTFTLAGTALGITFTNAGTSSYNLNTSGFTLTVDGSGITNNNTRTQTFSGTGAVTVGAAQTWNAASGDLTFSMSTLNINTALTLNGTHNISVSSATTLATATPITVLNTDSGANSFSGTVTLTGNRTIANNGTGSLTFGAVNLSSNGTTRTLTINGTGTTSITDVISNGTGGATSGNLTYSGTGSLTLSGNNTYSGNTTISGAGTVNINSATAFGTTGTVTISAAATLDNTSGSAITLTNNNPFAFNSNFTFTGTNDLNLGTGAVTLNATRTITVNGGNLTIGGAIGDGASTFGLTKAGAGTLILSGNNSYNGATTINAGTLSINSIANVSGSNSALGAPTTVANGTIAIGTGATGATLQYTGSSNASTNRVINLAGTTGGATLDSSGTGTITFTSAFTATGAGSKTLTVTGTNTGANTISGAIVDNSGTNKTSVAKTGTGEWVLSGANTYTGTTNITGGTLQVTNSNSLGSLTGGTVNISGGGTLDVGPGAADSIIFASTKQFYISGNGVGSNGAIINSSTNTQNNAFQNIALSADATIGGGDGSNNTQHGRWDIRGGANPTLDLAGHTLYKTGSDQVSVVGGTITNGDIVVNQGEFAIQTSTNATGSGTFTFNDGTTLGLWKNNSSFLTRAMTFNGNNTVLGETTTGSGNAYIGSNMTINGTTNFDIVDGSQITLNGQLIAGNSASTIVLNGANSAVYNNTMTYTYDGTLTLGANQTFNGTLNLAGGILDLNGFSLTVSKLEISGAAIIDFDNSLASILDTTNFVIDLGGSLTIKGWNDAVDYFYSTNNPGPTSLSLVTFNSPYSSDPAKWLSYTDGPDNDHQITPVPEPATYGALFMAGALGLFLWNRRRNTRTAVVAVY